MTHQPERSKDGKTGHVFQAELEQGEGYNDKIKDVPALFEVELWAHRHQLHHSLHREGGSKKLKMDLVSECLQTSLHSFHFEESCPCRGPCRGGRGP